MPVFQGPRTAHEHAALLQQLSSEHRDSPSPPESAAEQWSRSEVRSYFSSSGKVKPLLDRTGGGALLDKIGWRTRLERPAEVSSLEVMQLPGGAMAASEGHPEHFARVAKALDSEGVVAINFGVAGRYTDFPLWSDVARECSAASPGMKPVPGSDSQEEHLPFQALTAMAGGTAGFRHHFPILHALSESLSSFVLGMRKALSEGEHSLVLTSYTDPKVSRLRGGAAAGSARFDRERANGANGVEKRVDPPDGQAYTRAEFQEYYGGRWEAVWASAKQPTGFEDKRKLSAVLFLNENWKADNGGQMVFYSFDAEKGSFRARSLSAEADTLLLFRSDRVLYQVSSSKVPRFTLSTHFLGHYA